MKVKILRLFQPIKPSFYYILAALFLLYEMGVQSSPSVMANSLMAETHMNASLFGLAMGSYFLSYTVMQIPVGLLFDRYSAKWLLVVAVLVCTIGTYLFSFGYGVMSFSMARFFAGLGSAFAFVGVLVVANQWFSSRHFALLVGVAQWVAALGAMAGEMPLAYWVKSYGWRHTAEILTLIGIGLTVLMLLVLKSKTIEEAVTQNKPLASLKNILVNKQTYWIALYAFTAWAPITLFAELWGVPYLIVRQHASNVVAAQYSSFIWVGLAFSSLILGWWSDRLQKRRPFMLACSLVGLISVMLMLYGPWTEMMLVVLFMLSIGVAASGQILCFALVRDHFPQRDLAVAIGIVNMAVVVGGVLFQPLVGLLLQWQGGSGSFALFHFQLALVVMPILYFLGLWVSHYKIRDVR